MLARTGDRPHDHSLNAQRMFNDHSQNGLGALALDMADADLRDRIARLEADIEQLAEGLERCRKVMLLSRLAIAAGAICILVYFLGPIGFDPAIMVGAIALIVGGVVVLGSNYSTSKQTMAAMKDAEACKAELIGMIDLRTVGTGRTET